MRVADGLARVPFALQDRFKVPQELRQAVLSKIGGPALGLSLLLFIIKISTNRMMAVVHFDQPVGDGELQLVQPQPPGFILRRESEARPEIEQNVRGLRDQQPAGSQERRRKGPVALGTVFKQTDHFLRPPRQARDISVSGAGILEREADEFAAPLDARPVIELITHSGSPRSAKELRACRAARWDCFPSA